MFLSSVLIKTNNSEKKIVLQGGFSSHLRGLTTMRITPVIFVFLFCCCDFVFIFNYNDLCETE